MTLKISENGRFISDEKGEPFFYLADTAWEMLHRLSEGETDNYLRNRVAKGFTVIQTVILGELDGLTVPNTCGDLPLHDLDPTRPNEAYFAHVDRVLKMAHNLGLVVGLLPTWGDKWNLLWGAGPIVFTPENARIYGEFLERRYGNTPNIIWILGGDRSIQNETQHAIIEAMALGLEAGGSTQLKTFHPQGARGSSQYWHEASWLDFNMWQTGHGRNSPNFERIAADRALTPTKPTMDGEPGYEDIKYAATPEYGYSDDYDCRKGLYWALFSGACGHTYGCHPVWQFWQRGREAVNHPRREWREALDLPGAGQMQFARQLHDNYPFLTGKPADEMIVAQPQDEDGQENEALHVAVIMGASADFALLYFPTDSTVEVRLEALISGWLDAIWFNPRGGTVEARERIKNAATHEFTPPDWGPDWILILEVAT